MWLFNKISCEIQILNEKVWKLMIENGELREEIKQLEIDKIHWRDLYWKECEKNKKLEEENRFLEECLDRKEKINKSLREENKELKEQIELDDKISKWEVVCLWGFWI